MRFKKDALYPGEYHLPNGVFRATPQEMPYYRQRVQEMLKAGLHIPLSWEHQSQAKPTTVAEWERLKAQQLVLGWATGADLSQDGFLEGEFEVPDEEDLKKLPKWRFISPKIENNFRDPTGRVWPGPSITHFAVTPRPAQFNQKPFTLSQESFCLSLADVQLGDQMADEKPDKEKKGPPKEGEESDGGAGAKFKKVIQALAAKGMVLGDDTTPENFWDRVLVAIETQEATEGGGETAPPEKKPEEKAEEVGGPVMMSLEKENGALKSKLAKMTQESLETRIKGLAHIEKPIRDDLLNRSKKVELSFDTSFNPLLSDVEIEVRAFEKLKGKGSFIANDADLSIVDRPANLDGDDDVKRQNAAVERLAKHAGVKIKAK